MNFINVTCTVVLKLIAISVIGLVAWYEINQPAINPYDLIKQLQPPKGYNYELN